MKTITPDLGQRRRLAAGACTLAALAVVILCLTGCESPQSTFPAEFRDPTTFSNAPTAGRLNEGDVIRITFEADTNMNTVTKIQLEGNINLPLVGDVKAAGKTLEELKAELMRRHEDLLKVSEISVELVSSAASVTVSGAVLRPGKIPMERPLTALDAVMEAGGFDPNRARLDRVTVLRIENGQQRLYKLNLKDVIEGKATTPFYLKPFDNVHIPEKRFNL
jgi:polysaccharide export outer membrane protein